MKNILIIEDDPDIANLIKKTLEVSHYEVKLIDSGANGLKHYKISRPDMILLDLSLPDIDGMDICRNIRKTDEITPIFILSARTDEIDRIMGLELGADAFITKPFSIRELKAKMDVFFRRWDNIIAAKKPISRLTFAIEGEITRGPLRIDPSRKRAYMNEEHLKTTKKEFELLCFLANSPGKVFSREMIMASLWGSEWNGFERLVDAHVKRIRLKLEKKYPEVVWVETIWGVGYRFVDFDKLDSL